MLREQNPSCVSALNVRINHRARFCNQSELVKLGGKLSLFRGKITQENSGQGIVYKNLTQRNHPFLRTKQNVVAFCEGSGGARESIFFSVF